jgi:hypothetical protein
MKTIKIGAISIVALTLGAHTLPAMADESEAEIAKKTQNPVANLISVPFKVDYDQNIGPFEQGDKYQLTIQPVIPISISEDWNVISRTLVPIIDQKDFTPVSGSQKGFGDITPQFYFSPKAPTADGWIWGVGPQALLRSGANDLSADKWGLGPTGVLLKQEHGWTYGILANHMWSVGGSSSAKDINYTYLQPFLSFTTPRYTTYGINSESSYNNETGKWSVPINASITQMLKIGGQLLTLQGGLRYWLDSPDNAGPKGWGFRFQMTLLFPK